MFQPVPCFWLAKLRGRGKEDISTYLIKLDGVGAKATAEEKTMHMWYLLRICRKQAHIIACLV